MTRLQRLLAAGVLATLALITAASHADTSVAVPTLTLLESIDQALANNLELQVSSAQLAATAQQRQSARSELLPQLELGLEARRIDADRAEAGNGRTPRDLTRAEARFEQTLYSQQRLARLRVEQRLHAARSASQEAEVLDLIERTGRAYLEVLRSQSLTEIRADEVNLNASNLEHARRRLDLGTGNRGEVYRWETALARAQGAHASARAQLQQDRLQLNRLMSRPLQARYRLQQPKLSDAHFLIADEAVMDFFTDKDKHPALHQFFLNEATRHAPELKQARNEVAAQRRALRSSRRRYTHPEVRFMASAGYELSRHGVGTEELFIQGWQPVPDMDPIDIGGRTDDTEWMLALRAELPLYQGGRRGADVGRNRAQLDALMSRQDATLEQLEMDVLSRSHEATASFDSIEYARSAARAGSANLKLMREAHRQGVVTTLDLLDAQNAALAAELEAANAVYDFLIDYLAVQRVTGRFDLMTTAAERAEARRRLQQY